MPVESSIREADQTSKTGSVASQSFQQNGRLEGFQPISNKPFENHQDVTSDLSDDLEDQPITNAMDERAQSILGLSISKTATRMTSLATPAAEKAAAMEELDGRGPYDSENETPALEDQTFKPDSQPEFVISTSPAKDSTISAGKGTLASPSISDEKVPSVQGQPIKQYTLPIESRHAGPSPLVVESPNRQSSLYGIFDRGRKRSLSSGTDALKKLLPKSLPSMSQVGSLLGSISSKTSPISPNPPETSTAPHSKSASHGQNLPPSNPSSQVTFKAQVIPPSENPTERPKPLRRATSDNSLLYSTMSRSSSLGDDTRFANHREQVNSRVKAIRDTLQDRSTFRLPQLPSMPHVSNFSFNTSFLAANSNSPRWNPFTDPHSDILPAASSMKKPGPGSHVKDNIDMGGPAAAPQAAGETLRSVTDGLATQHLDRAMSSLTGDIVIMGGYRGSVLRSTADRRQVWVPVKVGLNIRKVNLEVGLDAEDEECMEESIFPSGMLQNIGPVDISKRLFKRLRHCENVRAGILRVFDYGYDWRLSPHLLSRKLLAFLEKLPSNQGSQNGSGQGALVICHSLGGLVTRHVVNLRPELFSGVIYAGVPHSCVNILGPMRNGDAVLLSSRVLTAQVNFTLRTSFLLLPEDGRCFVDINTKEEYPVDFFNVDDWIKYRWSPCTDPALPSRQNSGSLGNFLNRSGSLLSLPMPLQGKKLVASPLSPKPPTHVRADTNGAIEDDLSSKAGRVADVVQQAGSAGDRGIEPQMGSSSNPAQIPNPVPTAVTIPRDKAIAYLQRTLSETKNFKKELHFKSELAASNRYPPLAVIYGKSVPTCNGAKVDGREGIAHADAYDRLAFASGDGVVLAREAMLPDGYQAVFGGRIKSDRGHISLLGDLNAVGKALEAVMKGRTKGIGKGVPLQK